MSIMPLRGKYARNLTIVRDDPVVDRDVDTGLENGTGAGGTIDTNPDRSRVRARLAIGLLDSRHREPSRHLLKCALDPATIRAM